MEDSRNKLSQLAQEINIPEKSDIQNVDIDFVDDRGKSPVVKKKKGSAKIIYSFFLSLLVLMIVVVIGLGVIYAIKTNEDKSNNNSSDKSSEKTTDGKETDEEKVVEDDQSGGEDEVEVVLAGYYEYDGKVGRIYSDGVKEELFEAEELISNISGRDESEISYAICDDSCRIDTYNFNSKKVVDTVELKNMTTVYDLAWSGDGKTLVYFVANNDETRELFMYKDGESKSIDKWTSEILGRGGNELDDISIRFSPESSKFLLVNTITYAQEDPIVVYSIDGEEIDSIVKDGVSFATNPVWFDEETYYFNKNNQLMNRNVETKKSTMILEDFDYISLLISPDKKTILTNKFYQEEDKLPGAYLFDIESKKFTLLEEEFVGIGWLNETTVIGRGVIQEPMEFAYSNYAYDNVAKVGVDGKNFVVIDNSDIFDYSIQN